VARIAFQSLMRAAAVTLLEEYAADAMTQLQCHRARPMSIQPPYGPCAFVDSLSERIEYTANLVQRQPTAEVIVLHGLFDSGEAADQRDAFVDGFLEWVIDRYHSAHANTTVAVTAIEDLPNYVPEWIAPEKQNTYYATRIELEGLALSG
jgi:hypothetical protein